MIDAIAQLALLVAEIVGWLLFAAIFLWLHRWSGNRPTK